MLGLTVGMMITLAVLNGATCPESDMAFYSDTMAIVEVDLEENTVTAVDFNGNEWGWNGVEDWVEGDLVSVTMCNNGTYDTIYDDIIIDTRYSGWVDGNFGYWDGEVIVSFN